MWRVYISKIINYLIIPSTSHRRENQKKFEKIHHRKNKKNRFLLHLHWDAHCSVLTGDGLWKHNSKYFSKNLCFWVFHFPKITTRTRGCLWITPYPHPLYLSLLHRPLAASTSSSALHVPSNFTIMEPDLRLCSVKPLAEGVDRRFCLEVVSPSARHVLQVRRRGIFSAFCPWRILRRGLWDGSFL